MNSRPAVRIERQFVQTATGLRHIAIAGSGFPVLLLHQTPRSWDEYRDVLPLLGRHVRAIAMDTPGFGDSERLDGEASIEAWAKSALTLLDALRIGRACIVGHHTGAVIALEIAAAAPARVPALVLSSCSMVDPARRQSHAGKPVIDAVERQGSGDHVRALWAARQPFYPARAVDFLERYLIDALKAGPMAVEGHQVVNRYRMEERLPLVVSPTLVIDATHDPHAHPSAARVAAAISGAELVPIEGGMVPLPDHKPAEFADSILKFLGRLNLEAGSDRLGPTARAAASPGIPTEYRS